MSNVVLTFHAVPSREWLRTALEAVGRLYRFVSLSDLNDHFYRGRWLRGACHVTFDDGERSFLDHALPTLQAMGVPATLFVCPQVLAEGRPYWFQEVRRLRRLLGDQRVKEEVAAVLGRPPELLAPFGVNTLFKAMRLADIEAAIARCQALAPTELAFTFNMTPFEVQQVAVGGLVTVGAHTATHPVLANESDAEAERQIVQSVQTLREWLGRDIVAFAYPNGAPGLDFGPREQAILRRCGVRLAFTTATAFFGAATDPLAIPRVGLDGSPRETPTWITAKLLAVPAWDRIRRGREGEERRRLARLLSS
ncbi:MAG: polysaccharide deacetylase family protein [Caldilineales bacterium]|nr:polysaccharide deacetylase family protein [Caldilineales bacterium]MDW8316783.1 polysaccharide deacetylase family protein [Anaerolineae bacterium]